MLNSNHIINVGVIGVGYLGSFHVEQYQQIPGVRLVGCCDLDNKALSNIKTKYSVNTFSTIDDLLKKCDAVSVVTPTITHFNIAKDAIEAGCHVLIEKPITHDIKEAKKLLKLATKHNKIIQVGHIERFNPAFSTLKTKDTNPRFIESHRIAPFNTRGMDVDVVLDLMIHDIDIVLALVGSPVDNIKASGVAVLSKNLDSVNARIEFINGCVANLTASRIANKKIRKFRFFEDSGYTTIDFLNPSVERYVLHKKKPCNKKLTTIMTHDNKYITYDKLNIEPHNALNKELAHFIHCISQEKNPIVDGSSGLNALQLAIDIQNDITHHNKK